MGGWVQGRVGGWCGTPPPPNTHPSGAEMLKGALGSRDVLFRGETYAAQRWCRKPLIWEATVEAAVDNDVIDDSLASEGRDVIQKGPVC